MGGDVGIVRASDLTDQQRRSIVEPLERFSGQRGFAWRPQAVALMLAQGGSVAGGLIGATNWDWLQIEILAVAEHLRGAGWGRRLVAEAEAIAAGRDCVGAWVDTFTFQSPGFYKRLGYEVFGELPSYPGSERRIFLQKRF